METVRLGFQNFSNGVRGFFGSLLSGVSGLCDSAKTTVSAPVDLSGARTLDISGVDLSGSVITNEPSVLNSDIIETLPKVLKGCDIENIEKCKGCDCSINADKADEKSGLKLLEPIAATSK